MFPGTIINFSNNASALLQSVDGKMQGTIAHSGDTHNIQLDINQDGTFDGLFEDKNSDLKIELQGGLAKLISGKMPVEGLKIEADHHVVDLKKDKNNQLSGSIESKDVKKGAN